MGSRTVTAFTTMIALLAIGGIAAVAARDLAPSTPTAVAFAAGVGGALAVLGLAVGLMWLKFLVHQTVLNAGGTDTEWLWFKADPPGLRGLQQQHPTEDARPGA